MTAVIVRTVSIKTYSAPPPSETVAHRPRSPGHGGPESPFVRGGKPHQQCEADHFRDEQLPIRAPLYGRKFNMDIRADL